MTDKSTTKCHKIKNPCKICFQRVSHRNGLRCEGACKRWVHFKCLQYTPGRIADIKAGVIKVTCPCPDCVPSEPKEFLTNPPFTCSDIKCPANQLPKCTSSDCPMNMEGEGAYLHPGPNNQSGPSESPESFGSLPACMAKEPRPFKLCQPGPIESDVSIKSVKSAGKTSRPESPDITSCKAKLIALKDKLSAFAFGKLNPDKSPLSSKKASVDNIPATCNRKTCKNSPQEVPGSIPKPTGSKELIPKSQIKPPRKMDSPKKSKSHAGLFGKRPAKTAHDVSKSSPKPSGSKESVSKVQFRPAGKMDSPQKSKSFAGLFGTKPAKTKKAFNKKDCPASSSDSVIEVCKGQDSLLTALDDMCKTVGRLAAQIKDIMCKLDGAR